MPINFPYFLIEHEFKYCHTCARMKQRTNMILGAVCAITGGLLFVWMASWPQPQRFTKPWFFYFAELLAAAVIMGCGCAAFFAPIFRFRDVEEYSCEMVGYILTMIGAFESLADRHLLWGNCLVLIGYPVGRLCRRLAFPPSEKHDLT